MPGVYEKGEKEQRLISLFIRLTETEVGLTTRQLADELEVNTRTVQRYVATLRNNAGIDIEEKAGRWRIGQRSRLPPLQLDHYQATMLLVAVRLLQQLRPEQDPALVGALAHLSRALAVPLVSEYLRRTLAAAERRKPAAERLGVERAVIDGFVLHREIEVRYVDAKGKETARAAPIFHRARRRKQTHLRLRPQLGVARGALLPARSHPDGAHVADHVQGARRFRHRRRARRRMVHLAGCWWRSRRPPVSRKRSVSGSTRRRGLQERSGPISAGAGSRCVSTSPARWRCVRGCCDGARTSRCIEPPSLRAHMAETLAAAAALYASDPPKRGKT